MLNANINELLSDSNTQIFEDVKYSQIGSGKVINQVNEKERELYEKMIHRLESDNEYLRGLVNSFQK